MATLYSENTSASNLNRPKSPTGSQSFGEGEKRRDTQSDVQPGERGEGPITKQIESVTTLLPSGTFLGVAVGAMAVSALLQSAGRKEDSMFVGQWAPTLLILGLYNKLVKLQGSSGRFIQN